MKWQLESTAGSPTHVLMSGEIVVGWVHQLQEGASWRLDCTTRIKGYSKGGPVKSVALGKRSLVRAWRQWLNLAGLREINP